MRIVPASLAAWLHEGERDVIEINRHPWIPGGIGAALIALSPALYVGASSASLLTFTVVQLLVGFGIVSWLRKVAILPQTAILFRPVVGRPLEISLIGVKRVSKVVVSGEGGDYVIHRLEFIVGGFLDLPGGYLNQSVPFARLEEIVTAGRAISPP
jgi:hypothetical protein